MFQGPIILWSKNVSYQEAEAQGNYGKGYVNCKKYVFFRRKARGRGLGLR